MLRVRTLPRHGSVLDVPAFLCALAGGIGSVAAFVLIDDRLVAVGVASVALLPFCVLLLRAGPRERDTKVCPECRGPLPPPLENSPEEGEPILHHCRPCGILWFAGSTSS